MRAVAAMAMLFCCQTLVVAGETVKPEVQLRHVAGWNLLEAVVPGKLLSVASLDGGRTMYLLVEPIETPGQPPPAEGPADDEREEDAPLVCPQPENVSLPPLLELYRLELQRQELGLVRQDLPSDGNLLGVADLDGAGEEVLLLRRPGQLLALQRDRLVPLVEGPPDMEMRWHASADGFRAVGSSVFGGTLRFYLAGIGTTQWREIAALALPSTGSVQATGISVRYAVPRYLGRDQDGKLFYATPPEAIGPRRLQITLFVLDPSSGEVQVSDCWAGLPGPEKLLDYHFLLLEGQPMLLAETMPGNKLSLLGEKLLRLFPLQLDRSRLGLAPVFAVQSRMNLWQEAHPSLVDVNRDGRVDLVLGYWKGLISPRIALDAYVRQADGSFRGSPRTTAFDVEDGEGSYLHYGDDLDGDSLPDLLVRQDQNWLLYSGLPSSSGKKLVNRKATVLPLEVQGAVLNGNVELEVSAAGVSRVTAEAKGKLQFVELAEGNGRALLWVWPGDRSSPGTLQVLWREMSPAATPGTGS